MRFQTAGSLLALATGLLAPVAQAKTCLMLYQMADNNLEYYLRQDYEELTNSDVVQSGDLRLWVYYDALNQGGDPLINTVGLDGKDLKDRFTGSRYMTWDDSLGKMRVDVELDGEQNSDTKKVIQDFLEHAYADCQSGGFDSLFGIFSSHGGGFAGYGGDENKRRKLLQTNQGIVGAIKGALGNGNKLDVIGFDACLMQAIGAADDYTDVAKHILASEAVEPGHGWAYTYLQTAPNALELAKQILDTFINQKQGSNHQSPKTMAILNTENFGKFIEKLETFSTDLLKELKKGDSSLYTYVGRARSASVAFEGIVDTVGSTNPSGLDLGSFLEEFLLLCNPGGTLGTDLADAIEFYNNMFVEIGIGAGTSPGTGMHITWPNQAEYTANTALWQQVLFNNENYVTSIIPDFRDFLEWYLPSSTPSGGGDTICGVSSVPVGAPADPDALIITDSGGLKNGFFDVTSEISQDVSQILVEYGIDLSTPLKPVLREKGYEPSSDEYLYLLGGDVAGTYEGSDYKASWDQNFYFLNITGSGTFEALYVFDQGDGSKKIPAMYFPPERREDVANLQFLDFLFFDFEYWVEQGARFSFLKFSVDEAVGRINNNLALFTANNAGSFSELPRAAGGLLIPLIYIDAYIQGKKLDTLPGGFNQTVIEWTENLDYNLLTTSAERIFDVIPSTDAVVINMYAHDHGNEKSDVRYYDVIRPSKGGGGFTIEGDDSDSGGSSTPTAQGESTSSSTRIATWFGTAAGVAGLFFGIF